MDLSNLIFRLSGINIDLARKQLEGMMNLDSQEFENLISKRKDFILKAHLENNSFYKSKLGSGSLNWEDLPLLHKNDYQGEPSNLISKNYTKSDLYYSSTSGSSGHPFHFVKPKTAHALTWAISYHFYEQHHISSGSMQARFYGIPKEPLDYYKEKLKDLLLNRRRFPVFDLSDRALDDFVQKFRKTRFNYLYGYANSLLMFANYLVNKNIVLAQICPSLQGCITTSEMCSEEDRQLMKKAFGINIINEYGSSETGIMAFEDPDGDWVLNTWNQYFEIVNDEGKILNEGEEGNIIVTDLYNDAFPFIRYHIGDRGVISSKEKNGRKIKILKSLTGRINDTIILPSGKKAAGLTFYYVSRGILNTSATIKEFIIRQKSLDTFLFELVSDSELTKEQIKDIEDKLLVYLEPGVKLVIKRVDEIKRPASGKRKHFISEL